MIRAFFLALAALAGLGAVSAQTVGLPEIGIQSSGACRNLTVRDRANNVQVPIGCLDTSAPGGTFRLPFRQLGTGAVERSLVDKVREQVSALDFGADPTGVSDSLPAFSAAVTALATKGGGHLHYCGTFRLSAQLTIAASNIHLAGCGYEAATLLQGSATATGVSFGGAPPCCATQNVSISHTTVKPAPGITKTAGVGVRCAFTYRCDIRETRVAEQFVGIELYGASGGAIWGNYINNTVTASGSKALWDHGTAESNSVANDISRNNINGATKPEYGMFIGGGVQGEVIHFNNTAAAYKNLYVTTATGNADPTLTTQQLFFSQNAWDVTSKVNPGGVCTGGETAYNSATFITDGAGTGIATISIEGDWYASSLCGNALEIAGTNGPIDNIKLNGIQLIGAARSGALIRGNTTNIDITSPQAFGNSASSIGAFHGINIHSGVTHLSIKGGRSRPGSFYPNTQGYGIVLQLGASDYIAIAGVDTSGNVTGGILNLSTGTRNRIEGNIGYNPVGGSTITVGASPFTYTAGASPETVYCYGGTATGISSSGVGIAPSCPATIHLEPNQAMTISHTGAPTMTRIVH